MIELIQNKQDWTKVLTEMGSFDFYHTHEYHSLLAKEGEQPLLIHYRSGDVQIAFTFLMRKINDRYFDLTSVHGYLGPFGRGMEAGFDNTQFRASFENFLVEKNIVSVFSKLNPFVQGQDQILNSMGTIETIGELVYFDQTMDEVTQKSHYNRNTRQSLKKIQRVATVVESSTPDDIDIFVEIYHKTMDRLNANKVFYFDHDYFRELMGSDLVNCKLWFARHNATNDIIAAAFATQTGEICHLELMATNEEYFNLSPSRILYDHARSNLKGERIKYLVLGGGSGGREGSLMRFKSSFTQNYVDLRIWKHIINPVLYESLQTDFQRSLDSSYFPKYRSPNR